MRESTRNSESQAPRAAFVMTVYNQGHSLPQAMQSIRDQTERCFECIVVDDGSDDTTAGVLQEFAQQDNRIRVLSPGRLGRGKALRVATDALSPSVEFVANLDADDTTHPSRLSKQIQFLVNHPGVGMVGSWVIIESAGEARLYRRPTSPSTLRRRIGLDYPFIHSSICYRRRALEQAGGFSSELSCCLDYDLASRIALNWSVANIAAPLCRLRKHEHRFFKSVPASEFLATKESIAQNYVRSAKLSWADLMIARTQRALFAIRNRLG